MLERIRKAQKDEGFTLIELLIVIVILGILAAIVVFAVSSTRKDSVTSSCKTDIKSIQLAAEAYRTKNGTYPATDTTVTSANGGSKMLDAQGGLLNSWPDSDQYTLNYAATPTSGAVTGYQITASSGGKITGSPTITNTSTTANIAAFCAGT